MENCLTALCRGDTTGTVLNGVYMAAQTCLPVVCDNIYLCDVVSLETRAELSHHVLSTPPTSQRFNTFPCQSAVLIDHSAVDGLVSTRLVSQ